MNLNLGLIYRDGEVVNHRSLFKLMINPFLRWFFGKEFGSWANIETGKFVRYAFVDVKLLGDLSPSSFIDELKATWNYSLQENDSVVKYRRIW